MAYHALPEAFHDCDLRKCTSSGAVVSRKLVERHTVRFGLASSELGGLCGSVATQQRQSSTGKARNTEYRSSRGGIFLRQA